MNKYIILLFIMIVVLTIYNLYVIKENYKTNENNIKILKKEIRKINYNKTKCEILPKKTTNRCCPDSNYTIYEDNPWIYQKNPYIDSNTNYDINWYRRDGPRLPNRISYPSQYDNCEFKQIGVLSPLCQLCKNEDKCNCNNQKEILPLYSKPSKYNRNNYNYYTVNNGNQNLNLQVPIEYKSKNCMDNNGCNEIYDKDMIRVPIFNKDYEVSIYPNN